MVSSKGFTLLELLLVIGITTSMAVVTFQDKMLETEQAQARRLGMEIFQYNSAVQNYLAHSSGLPNPASLQGTYTGINWLKSSSCGGTADKEWLSCKFLAHSNGKTSFGRLGFTTEIKYDPTAGLTGRTVMTKLMLGSIKQERADLAGLAALVASGAYAVSEDGKAVTAQDSTVAYCPDTAGTSPINAVCQGDKGAIVMLSRNLSAADRWLRVDHGNVMQNVLEFRTGDPTPASQADIHAIDSVSRQIRNVARIYNLGSGNSNGESDNLYLGKKNGDAAKAMVTLPNNAVIVDADQEVLGKLVVAASIDAQGDISTKGNLRSGGDASIGKNLSVEGTTKSVGDLTTDGNLGVSKNAVIGGKTTSIGDISGQDNLAIAKDGAFGGKVTAQNINANGELSSNTLNIAGGGRFGGDIYAPKIVDSNDNNYYIDSNQSSRMNAIDANSIKSRGSISSDSSISGTYFVSKITTSNGASCADTENGAIAKNTKGEVLTCQSGIWKKDSGGFDIIYGSNPQCPPGKTFFSRYWNTPGGSNYGYYCGLRQGWSGTPHSCESCLDFERCHMVYSSTWSAASCI
jgi:type II secretory pathway pseudopilin PulG/cytoskeletal protein CcmA (bactofilin family)